MLARLAAPYYRTAATNNNAWRNSACDSGASGDAVPPWYATRIGITLQLILDETKSNKPQ